MEKLTYKLFFSNHAVSFSLSGLCFGRANRCLLNSLTIKLRQALRRRYPLFQSCAWWLALFWHINPPNPLLQHNDFEQLLLEIPLNGSHCLIPAQRSINRRKFQRLSVHKFYLPSVFSLTSSSVHSNTRCGVKDVSLFLFGLFLN